MSETEVKFYVRDLQGIEERLRNMGASRLQPRLLERNLRFDTSNGELRAAKQVLRLRQSHDIRLTFKGPSENLQGILKRVEIEFSVDDFEAARKFLEALGFSTIFQYEKYRTTYAVEAVHVMLDELPYGDFVEIEGEEDNIRAVTARLHLNGDRAVTSSYHELFEHVASDTGIQSRDLTFDEFPKRRVRPEALGVQPAD